MPAAVTAAPAWSADLQRCDVCGTANELSRAFCLNCGAKLKKAGTVGGVAAAAAARDGGGMSWRPIVYVVGGLVIFLGFAALAFAALGGFGHGAPAPLPTAPASTLVAANPGVSSAPSIPGATVLPPGSVPPAATAPSSVQPPPTTVASAEPSAVATPPAPTTPPATPAPPPAGFVCTASTFSASQPGGWKIFHAHWTRRGPADTLYLEMQSSLSSSTASVDANILPPDQVQPTYGVPGPSSGSVAVVLAFNDAVSLTGPFGSMVGYKALQEFQIYRTGGRVIVVMGVNGAGCYGLSSDAWTSGSATAPELAVAIQH